MQKRCLLLSIAGFIITLFCTAVWAGPIVHFPEMEWDWGKVYTGDQIVHVFNFENKGDKTLFILNVSTSCGCTAALATHKEVPPGGKGKIEVTFNTTGYRGRSHKAVYISTNDPAMKKAILKIYGDVQVDLVIRPNTIYTGFRKRNEAQSRRIILTNKGQKPIRLLEVISHPPEIISEINGEHTIEPGGDMRVPLKLKLPEKGNRFFGRIILRTDHPKHKEVVIPVRLQMMLPIPGRAMKKTPFLEKLRKYYELKEKQESKEKAETSQAPGALK